MTRSSLPEAPASMPMQSPASLWMRFLMAGESNLVFIINELDKAASGKGNGNPADVLLTLLDNLGFHGQLHGVYDPDCAACIPLQPPTIKLRSVRR